jgi:hypothetical protein
VLAPALEGFSPTPEFPDIGETQALLAELSQSDEVMNAAASRQRRLKLQTNYGRALAWSRGFATEETKAAFTRARELSGATDVSDERFATLYGQWVTTCMGGELGQARDIAGGSRRFRGARVLLDQSPPDRRHSRKARRNARARRDFA